MLAKSNILRRKVRLCLHMFRNCFDRPRYNAEGRNRKDPRIFLLLLLFCVCVCVCTRVLMRTNASPILSLTVDRGSVCLLQL